MVNRAVGWFSNLPRDIWPILLLLSMALPLYWDRLRNGRHLARVDIVTYYLPNFTYLGEQLRSGNIPGWNPYTSSGMPFLGDPQSGWSYLPAMVSFSIFDPLTALKAHFLFHVWLAGLGAYALGRVYGLNLWGATAAAVAYEYGGIVAQLRAIVAHAQMTAWLPLALVGFELAIRAGTLRSRAVGWSIGAIAVSQMVVGWTGQGSAYALLFLGLYVSLRFLTTGIKERSIEVSSLVRHGTDGAAVVVFGLGLAAASLLIRLEVNKDSLLAGGNYEGVPGASTRPLYLYSREFLSQILYPSAYYYIGGATVALAITALVLAKSTRWLALTYAAIALVMVDLAHAHGIIRNIWFVFPRFEGLHEHSIARGLVLFGLPVAMLAGIATDALSRRNFSWKLLAGLGLGFILLSQGLYVLLFDLRPRFQPEPRWMMVTVGATLVLFALSMAIKRFITFRGIEVFPNLLLAALLVAIALDPFGLQMGKKLPSRSLVLASDQVFNVHTSSEDPSGPGEFLQRQLEEEGPFRFLGYAPSILSAGGEREDRTYHGMFRDPLVVELLFNRAWRLGLYNVQGYNPSQNERYSEFLSAVNGQPQNYHDTYVLPDGIGSPLLQLLNLKYVIVPNEETTDFPEIAELKAEYPTVYSDKVVSIVEVTDPTAAAWIVHDAVDATRERAFELIQERAFDPESTAVIEGELPDLEAAQDPDVEQVAVTHYAPEKIELSATLTAPGIVVLSEVYARGWQAFVDGKETEIYPTNYAFRGVAVPEGTHVIEFKYAPPAIVRGIAITLITAAILVTLVAQPWRLAGALGRRRSRSANS